MHTLDGLDERDMVCHAHLDGMSDGRLMVSGLPASKTEGFVNKIGADFHNWLQAQELDFGGASITMECRHSKFATHVKAVKIEEWDADAPGELRANNPKVFSTAI